MVTSNPNSPAQVRDAHFSPVSDVRKTLELIESSKAGPSSGRPAMPPPLPSGQSGQSGPALQAVPEARRSNSAKRLRAASQETKDPRTSPSWTTRSLRVPMPGRSVPPSFRETLEIKPEAEAQGGPAATSWIKTYTKILQAQAVKPVNTANTVPHATNAVPNATGGSHQYPVATPNQAWRSQPVAVPVVPLGVGSFRLCPPLSENDERSPNSARAGYHSARIRVEEEKPVKEEKAQEEGEDQKESEDVLNLSAVSAPPPRTALTLCNIAATQEASLKGKEGKEKTMEKTPELTPEKAEKNPEKTPETQKTDKSSEACENVAPSKPELWSPLRVPGTWSPAPAFYMKPRSVEVCRMQGISTSATSASGPYMPCSTPPMPMTPPVPMRMGDSNMVFLRERNPTQHSWVQVQRGISHGVYRTYSTTGPAPIPWFPKPNAQHWPIPDKGSPLRRRQINV